MVKRKASWILKKQLEYKNKQYNLEAKGTIINWRTGWIEGSRGYFLSVGKSSHIERPWAQIQKQ